MFDSAGNAMWCPNPQLTYYDVYRRDPEEKRQRSPDSDGNEITPEGSPDRTHRCVDVPPNVMPPMPLAAATPSNAPITARGESILRPTMAETSSRE